MNIITLSIIWLTPNLIKTIIALNFPYFLAWTIGCVSDLLLGVRYSRLAVLGGCSAAGLLALVALLPNWRVLL